VTFVEARLEPRFDFPAKGNFSFLSSSMTSQEGDPTLPNDHEDFPTMGPLIVRSRNPYKIFCNLLLIRTRWVDL
jgi:hypothetical protein